MSQGFTVSSLARKADARGVLVELVRDLPAGAQVYLFTIAPGQTRGGHWHARKAEWFTCIAGHATLMLQTGVDTPFEIPLTGDFTSVVHVQPGTRHTFTSQNGATVLACISESFDPNDPDTHFPPPPK